MNNGVANIPVSSKELNSLEVRNKTNNYSNTLKNKSSLENNFKQVLDKTSKYDNKNNREDTSNIEKSKLKENIAYSKGTVTRKSDTTDKEITSSDDKKVQANHQENDLMLLLQQLLQGKISFEEFAEKALQGEGQLEKLSLELTNIGLEGIEEKFSLGQGDLEELQGKISSDLTQIIKNMLLENGQENNSFELLMGEATKKAFEHVQINELDGGNPLSISMHEQIMNNIKNKLQENNLNKQTDDFTNELNSNITGNLQDNIVNKLQVTSNNSKDFSKESNSEDKFLKDLVAGNKNDITNKVDKLVNFMSTFNKAIDTSNISEVGQAVTINKNTFIHDIIKSVKFMEQNDMKEMTVKLMPRELGEIVIKLTMQNGLMKASITANNKEAYNLLNSNLQDINKLIGNEEIKIQNVTINIYNEDTTFFSRENSKEQNKHSGSRSGSRAGISKLDIEEGVDNVSIVEESSVNAFV